MDALDAFFVEQKRWSTLQMPLHALAEAVPELLNDLSRFDSRSNIALLTGLLRQPCLTRVRLPIELLLRGWLCETGNQDVSDAPAMLCLLGQPAWRPLKV